MGDRGRDGNIKGMEGDPERLGKEERGGRDRRGGGRGNWIEQG